MILLHMHLKIVYAAFTFWYKIKQTKNYSWPQRKKRDHWTSIPCMGVKWVIFRMGYELIFLEPTSCFCLSSMCSNHGIKCPMKALNCIHTWRCFYQLSKGVKQNWRKVERYSVLIYILKAQSPSSKCLKFFNN